MRRRFWVAVAVGGLVGAGAVASFGPYVRSKVEAKAERYGAAVEVQHVIPGWEGVKLEGISVSVKEMPGVKIWLDGVTVGWRDQRPKSFSGGKIVAVGEVGTLVSNFESWRAERFGKGGGSGNARPLSLEGFELDWRDGARGVQRNAQAKGVSVSREGGSLSLAAAELNARFGAAKIAVGQGRLKLVRADEGYRVEELTSQAMTVEYAFARPEALADSSPAVAAASASASGGPTNGGAKPPASAPSSQAATKPVALHRRVRAARQVRARLREVAARLDSLTAEDAHITVGGARARLLVGDDALNLGPGTFRLTRDAGDLLAGLEPLTDASPKAQALTFSFRIPVADNADERPIRATMRGGPVSLSVLGIKEGDLGLKNVARTTIESDVKVELPSDGETVSVEGHGKVHQLSLHNRHLAALALEGVELAWRTDIVAKLDGSHFDIREAELDLGDIRTIFRGSYARSGDDHKVDIGFELPLMTCQRCFESIPHAMVPKLTGMRFAGSIAARGHARFDTANLMKSYDVDWVGSMSCRIVEAPPDIQTRRFKTKFDKVVYTPKAEERQMTFGPDTDNWVPINSISHFMEGAVLTTEDGRFFRHGGFDKEAIVNSIRENIKARRFMRGASTISMQLAKNLYLPRAKTLSRKLQEAILTLYLEQELTKREMMEMYLNIIEYGPMVYGVGPAARHYFNSHPSRLSLSQALYLGSILRDPKKQYFAAGGAVIDSHTRYLRRLMKIVHKIGRISDDELDLGLRETVIRGSPSPMVTPPEDDIYPDDPPIDGPVQNAWAG